MAVNAPAPPLPQRTSARSVEGGPISPEMGPGGGNAFVFWMASIADTFEPWGRDVANRDRELRDFWHTESFLAGAVFTCAVSNASFEWEVDGPSATVDAVHELLNQADLGKGWRHFATKLSIDLYTQDNGGFIEVIRERNSASAPVLGIQHLDAARCQRTGDLQFPVIYTDNRGTRHKMPWYSVIALEEFPSPVESMYGVQYSAVTRVLRSAQVLRDFAIYRGEKAGGRFTDAVHVVGGVKSSDIEDLQRRAGENADNQGLVRYLGPLILGSLDPGSNPSVATLELKSMPEGFDYDKELKWYISGLALGFGRDYQDFAPLSQGNLGTSAQSEVLHMKTRGKGPAAFMRMLEQAFNFHGVMPRSVTFRFKEQDIEAEKQEAEVKKTRAETRKVMLDSLEIVPEIARQLALDDGDLKQEYIDAMGERDLTPTEPVEGSEKPEQSSNGRVEQIDTQDEMLKAMMDSLTRRAENTPALRAFLQESAKEVTQEPIVAALARSIQAMPETLRSELFAAMQESLTEIAVSTKSTMEEVTSSMRDLFSGMARELKASLNDRVDDLAAENRRRAESVGLAVKSLNTAMKDLEKQQQVRKTASEVAQELRAEAEDSEVVEQIVLERDPENRMKVVRKVYASGRTQDFQVVRDRDGFVKRLKEVRY